MITANMRRRSRQHRLDPEKAGKTMKPLTGPLPHGQARTIEAMRIRRRLDEARARGLIDGTEPIEEQLRKAGLQNKNRGRDPNRWEAIDPAEPSRSLGSCSMFKHLTGGSPRRKRVILGK